MPTPGRASTSATRGAAGPTAGTRWLRRLGAAALAAAVALPTLPHPRACAGDEPGAPESDPLDRARRQAIERGCAFLAAKQSRGGSFGEDKAIIAFTALSTLALMSSGSSIERGPYGTQVKKGVDFLVGLLKETGPRADRQVPDGFFAVNSDNNSKMHGQGYATLCLASALGSAKEDRAAVLRDVLRRAVACSEYSQTGTGGWGYEPDPRGEHEGSVTVTVAQGLRAARDAGLLVNDAKVKLALRYLRNSQKNKPGQPEDGSFKYSITTERSTYALTAAAISAFFLFGEYGNRKDPSDAIQRGIAYMKAQLSREMRVREWFFYGNFYAAWAAWQWDGDEPDAGASGFWGPWHREVYRVLIEEQANDGSWFDAGDRFNFGQVLATAFAVLTLAIPDEQLPIFQR